MYTALLAHWISHAIAGIKPLYHGWATTLDFEIGPPHLLASNSLVAEPASRAFGAALAAEMLDYLLQFLDKIGVKRTLPKQFCEATTEEYLAALQVPKTGSI